MCTKYRNCPRLSPYFPQTFPRMPQLFYIKYRHIYKIDKVTRNKLKFQCRNSDIGFKSIINPNAGIPASVSYIQNDL